LWKKTAGNPGIVDPLYIERQDGYPGQLQSMPYVDGASGTVAGACGTSTAMVVDGAANAARFATIAAIAPSPRGDALFVSDGVYVRKVWKFDEGLLRKTQLGPIGEYFGWARTFITTLDTGGVSMQTVGHLGFPSTAFAADATEGLGAPFELLISEPTRNRVTVLRPTGFSTSNISVAFNMQSPSSFFETDGGEFIFITGREADATVNNARGGLITLSFLKFFADVMTPRAVTLQEELKVLYSLANLTFWRTRTATPSRSVTLSHSSNAFEVGNAFPVANAFANAFEIGNAVTVVDAFAVAELHDRKRFAHRSE
jgi:hypothetical protein